MKTRSPLPPVLPLVLALASLALFPLGIAVMEQTQAWIPALKVSLPAVAVAFAGLLLGVRILQTRPQGKTYGLAMIGSLTGGFSILFWMTMVPMLLIIAYPARQSDPTDPEIALSQKQMLVLVRHLKTFEQEFGRLPVRLEELVDKGYIQPHTLYDPRQRKRDAPSYRLMVRELPSSEDWEEIPILEGRIPDREGYRLSAFANETTGRIPPPPRP
jgi:hypothetical protein